MKSKILRRLVSGIGTTLLLGITNPLKAENSEEILKDRPVINFYLEQSNQYRAAAGFTPVNTPVTNLNVGITYGNLDGFIWGAHNNKSGDVNEVDAGIGYSFGTSDKKLTGRVGFERWMFTEKGGNVEVLDGNLRYNNLLTSSLNVKQLLDDGGTAYRVGIEKYFDVSANKFPLGITPYAKTTCLDNFFGVTNCPSNSVFGTLLSTNIFDLPISLSGEYHKGEGSFKDTLVGKLRVDFNLY